MNVQYSPIFFYLKKKSHPNLRLQRTLKGLVDAEKMFSVELCWDKEDDRGSGSTVGSAGDVRNIS